MIAGEKVRLRAPEEKDLEILHAMRNDVALQGALMARPRANSLARVREWIEARMNDMGAVFFVIARVKDDHAVGFVQVLDMDHVSGVGELGICCAETVRGMGFGTEALALLERYLVEVFGLRKLTLRVLASNAPAVRFYETHGFDRVGTYRRHFYHDGDFHDVDAMEKHLGAGP